MRSHAASLLCYRETTFGLPQITSELHRHAGAYGDVLRDVALWNAMPEDYDRATFPAKSWSHKKRRIVFHLIGSVNVNVTYGRYNVETNGPVHCYVYETQFERRYICWTCRVWYGNDFAVIRNCIDVILVTLFHASFNDETYRGPFDIPALSHEALNGMMRRNDGFFSVIF